MTIAQIEALLVNLELGLSKAAQSQSYSFNMPGGSSRTVSHQNITELRKEIEYWENRLAQKKNSGGAGQFGMPTKFATPADDR